MQLETLCKYCDDFLNIHEFNDYCPNGLQVESCGEVKHIVTGVTASLALIDAAIDVGADTILVHHGYFWKGESQPITGFKAERIRKLIRNNINLLAYHLPLDAHPDVGNNAQLARVMNWAIDGSFGSVGAHDIVLHGKPQQPLSIEQLGEEIAVKLGRKPLIISAGKKQIRSIAWCTGAAQSYIEAAASRGIDAFISGEVSEHTFHFAREMGIDFIAAGHHATERFGVQALGQLLQDRFKLRHQFIDIENPV